MLAKFEDDKRLETMNAMRRKREIANYRAEVERLVEERRAQYEAVRAAEMKQAADKAREELDRKAIVEKERQRLLAEHAANLKEFLPKGVVLNANDYALVHGAAKPLPAHLQPGAQPQKNHGKRFNVFVI